MAGHFLLRAIDEDFLLFNGPVFVDFHSEFSITFTPSFNNKNTYRLENHL